MTIRHSPRMVSRENASTASKALLPVCAFARPTRPDGGGIAPGKAIPALTNAPNIDALARNLRRLNWSICAPSGIRGPNVSYVMDITRSV